MNEHLDSAGYEQTRRKLAEMLERLSRLEQRSDADPHRVAEVRRSYERMIAQYRREIRVYEVEHPQSIAAQH